MNYEKICKLGNMLFIIGGSALIWTSVYRLGFGEPLSVMPRAAYIVASELLTLGIVMILCAINLLGTGSLLNILKLLWGKAFFCLFVAGFMDVVVYSFSNLVTLINLGFFALSGFFFVTGIFFVMDELRSLYTLRK